ncbi:MAG: DegV family protein [Oscillospiraceae bacterium]
MPIKIISDSSCDISNDDAKKLDIEVVPFYISFDGLKYIKEREDIATRDFYKTMVENPDCFPKSSLPSIQDYMETFDKYASEGFDIICICITTKFSGSFNSATNAAQLVREKYPNIKISIINSMINTVLQGLLVREVVRMNENNLSFEEIVEKIEEIKTTGRIIFTIGSMSYLAHGGRMGKVLTGAASTLRILPIITLKDGEIFPSGIVRSRKASLTKVLEKVNEHFTKNNFDINDYSLAVGYGYDVDEAKIFHDDFTKSAGSIGNKCPIAFEQIGSTIAVHTGPHPLGVGLIKKYDR